MLKTMRGFHEEFFVKITIKESSDYIDLVTLEIIESNKSHNELEGREADDRGKGFKIVDAFLLQKSFDYLTSLKASDGTVGITFSLEYPATLQWFAARGERVAINFTEDASFHECLEFFVHSS